MKLVIKEVLPENRDTATHIVVFNFSTRKGIEISNHFMHRNQRHRIGAVGQWHIKRKKAKCNFTS